MAPSLMSIRARHRHGLAAVLIAVGAALAACRPAAPSASDVLESGTPSAATATTDTRVKVPVKFATADPAWPRTYHALAYDPANTDTLWFTYGPGILRNNAGGTGDWTAIESSDTGGAPLYALVYAAKDSLLAGGRGVFRVSHDAGATWEPVADLGEAQVKGLTALPDSGGALLALVGEEGILRSEDGGTSWESVGPTPAALAFGLWVVQAKPLRLLTYDRGELVLLASDDLGVSWRRLQAEGLDTEVGAVALAADGTAYAASKAGLFASMDGGRTWEPRGKQPPLVAVAVAPDDAAEITAIDEQGRVFQSKDSGKTW